MKKATLVFGNQLFPNHPAISSKDDPVIMIEAFDICTKYKYHKHKLVFILSAMREYRDNLLKSGHKVIYVKISKGNIFFEELKKIVRKYSISHISLIYPENREAISGIDKFFTKNNIKIISFESPGFLTPKNTLEEWFIKNKKPLMEYFYRWQRKRLNILVKNNLPEGGSWNYDKQNRDSIPKNGIDIPKIVFPPKTSNVSEVAKIVDQLFPNNPGETNNFWLPVNRIDALSWLNDFVKNRLVLFGKYEDAMVQNEPFLFHSVLSPILNIGLITPEEVVEKVLKSYYKEDKISINSVEGFIRQIIGWREYVRGVYWHKKDLYDSNYFGFTKDLEDWWYTKDYQNRDLPIPVLDSLKTLHLYGYNHHIQRLMVLGNWFLLNEYNPLSVYRWFMSMYVDAYDWVMAPNVLGMSQFADGGYVATKPYISGGNYLQKMGNFWPTAKLSKESEFTKKYWNFLAKNREKLKGNYRLNMLLSKSKKISNLK